MGKDLRIHVPVGGSCGRIQMLQSSKPKHGTMHKTGWMSVQNEPTLQTTFTMTPESFQKARQLLGFTQTKMASELGVSMQTIQAWEQGRNPIARPLELAVLHLCNQYKPR